MVDDAAPDTQPGRPILTGLDHDDDTGNRGLSPSAPELESRSSRRRRRRKHRKVNPGLARKFDLMTQLLRNLDALVYAELCTLYYMECSIFRFAVRVYGQHHWLTPKPDDYPLTMEAPRSQVISVFVPNLLCILLHIFAALPTAGEAARGYLHGGVIVDFIGQKPPTSRLTFLALDFIILAVQCLMLAVHAEREKLRAIVRPNIFRLPHALEDQNAATSTQDLDAEERGVLRDAPGLDLEGADSVELQPLRPQDDAEPSSRADRSRERSRSSRRRSSIHSASGLQLFDVLSSGNGVLGEFHISHTIRNATTDFRGAAGHSLQTLGYTATLTRLSAIRRMPHLERNQRNQR
ncbi:DSC E3 ubiquitin ligase complex subunit 4 [Colletotrichum orbiculare MAFF 240422]|uniref:DSC E3 ubiquitin ligase complex subunit 4 n=1 Tax=Colletotrichum orbiculare (strain 104-T / ATCC 96160 / CBS 514.97 / LARS 414 / MAFF 240422) TaxID=1213857 RepID=A0A484G6Z5_COLOR|nr:DSC E3 ubiquitin ligase complex subunit 4 [Colletotrichum orbiculare MAFF 240422]